MYEIIGKAKKAVKILTLDIETSPATAYTFGLWDVNIGISQVIDPGGILSVAAKWYDERGTRFHADWTEGGHTAMIRAIWQLLDDADVIVHYNGKAFDIKHLNREFLLLGLTPPSPYAQVDLLQVVRSNFKFLSGKLDFVAQQLGLGSKLGHTGFKLWADVMAGDAKAQGLMRRYNIQDVVLTEKLYDRLRPWIKNHPHMGMLMNVPDACSNCGRSGPHEYAGIHRTLHQAYDRFKCRSCGIWLRGNTKLQAALTTRQAA